MSKIFISFYNFTRNPLAYDKFPPFYESFVNGLVKLGHEVFVFHFKSELDFSRSIPKQIEKIILQINPDLFIFFDNKFWDVTELTSAPILIYDVDSPIFYSNQELLKRKPLRFDFLSIQSDGVEIISNFLENKSARIAYSPPFTSIKADKNTKVNKNIVFVGCNWLWGGLPEVLRFLNHQVSSHDKERAIKYLREFSLNPNSNIHEVYSNTSLPAIIESNEIVKLAFQISGLKRIKTFDAISDLGLEIHGTYWDAPCLAYFPDVAFCIDKQNVSSLRENENLYNSAKIGVNTNHIQATTGFSWRVCDILASNACLLTEYKSDLRTLFPDVDIPTFETPYEAREEASKLLKDEVRRKEIVEQAHAAIDSRHRFHHQIQRIDVFLGTNLLEGDARDLGKSKLTILSDRNLKTISSQPQSDNFSPTQRYFDNLSYRSIGTLFAKKVYYQNLFPILGNEGHLFLKKLLKRKK